MAETSMAAWVVKIEDELERMDAIRSAKKKQWDKHCIYRVPESLTDLNQKAYKPQTVSFGPYHNGEDHLKPMEEHKLRALLHFFARSKKKLTSCVDSLTEIAQSLKDSYESLAPYWEGETGTGRFLQMMILDGCFMIEVLSYCPERVKDDYADNDPIFSSHGKLNVVPYIRRDMLMLENQLPMLLLTMLLDEETKQDKQFVNKLIFGFFYPEKPGNPLYSGMAECLHLLDVYREMLVGKKQTGSLNTFYEVLKIVLKRVLKPVIRTIFRTNRMDRQMGGRASRMDHEMGRGHEIIRSAVELEEAGISFKKSKGRRLDEISFTDGELRLPPIVVNDTTESMYLNLIAFERFHVGVENTAVRSYIFFMDSLIDTAKDVRLLRDNGIIQNAFGSDEAAAALFNSITKDTTIDQDINMRNVHKKIDEYCKKPWNKWRAYAKHNYFNNPWAMVSVIAAFVLFVLTSLQTVYSMLSYYHHPSS